MFAMNGFETTVDLMLAAAFGTYPQLVATLWRSTCMCNACPTTSAVMASASASCLSHLEQAHTPALVSPHHTLKQVATTASVPALLLPELLLCQHCYSARLVTHFAKCAPNATYIVMPAPGRVRLVVSVAKAHMVNACAIYLVCCSLGGSAQGGPSGAGPINVNCNLGGWRHLLGMQW